MGYMQPQAKLRAASPSANMAGWLGILGALQRAGAEVNGKVLAFAPPPSFSSVTKAEIQKSGILGELMGLGHRLSD